jgi:hypothetical protein
LEVSDTHKHSPIDEWMERRMEEWMGVV